MIQIKELTKTFGKVIAVNNLTLDIQPGINGLVGHNGAGKSTLLRLIADVYRKDKGEILIDGRPNSDKEAKTDLFFLSDSPFYHGNDYVKETANLYASLFDLDIEKFYEIMGKLSLPVDRRLSTFSKGMRRQMFIALSLSMKAHFILLDEAFDGLDPLVQEVVQQVIKEEITKNASEKTFLISSHNLSSLEKLCDSFIILSKGRCLKEGEKEDLGKYYKKFQIIFKEDVTKEDLEANGIPVVSLKKVGSITQLVVEDQEDTEELIKKKYKPTLIESVPVDKEEIIRIEMIEAKGDETK